MTPPGWHTIALDLADPPNGQPVRATAQVLTPAPTATFGVVSDMDDTVLQSEVTSFLRAARMVLLENALTRLPFPGVAAFYRALDRGATGAEANPIFYVSSSPWNLYDVIDGFLEAQRIPVGPLLLRDWDLGKLNERHARHKSVVIREIFDTYPELPFLLVGDSGQEDPEIYTELVRERPGRVKAVYIRNVSANPERSERIRALAREVAEAGSTLVLADDTLAVARHAAMHGWIASDALDEIGGEKRDDEGATGAKADAPGVDTKPAPTVVVDPARLLGRRDMTAVHSRSGAPIATLPHHAPIFPDASHFSGLPPVPRGLRPGLRPPLPLRGLQAHSTGPNRARGARTSCSGAWAWVSRSAIWRRAQARRARRWRASCLMSGPAA